MGRRFVVRFVQHDIVGIAPVDIAGFEPAIVINVVINVVRAKLVIGRSNVDDVFSTLHR